MPGPLPTARLRLDVPSLCLVAIMRLRAVLEKIVAATGEPKRICQLRAAMALEGALAEMSRAMPRSSRRLVRPAGHPCRRTVRRPRGRDWLRFARDLR
jgi:hypothetical protein